MQHEQDISTNTVAFVEPSEASMGRMLLLASIVFCSILCEEHLSGRLLLNAQEHNKQHTQQKHLRTVAKQSSSTKRTATNHAVQPAVRHSSTTSVEKSKAPKGMQATSVVQGERSTRLSKQESEKRQLEKIREEIARDKAKLEEIQNKERILSSRVQQIRQRDAQITTALRRLDISLSKVQDSLRVATKRIRAASSALGILHREYGDIAYSVSRAYVPTIDAMMLGVASAGEEILWNGTIQHVSRVIVHTLQHLERQRDTLQRVKERFASKEAQTAALKAQQAAEKDKVHKDLVGKTHELHAVQATKQELIRRLEERNASARKLEAMINKLVDKATVSLAPHHKSSSLMMRNAHKSDDNSQEQAAIEARAASIKGGFRRHSLLWPVEGRTVLHKFGRYTNRTTGTLIENLGIAIAAQSGSSVRAVERGVVSLVNWLPGYGLVVIIDHGNTFRTVYANLALVSVQAGQNVQRGTILGRSGRAIDGEYVHFELWHDRNKLNPELWLE
ncbi:MAG: peptidoglycan DD-metalloendopeptidase family protein [Bacteroidota bacterium]|nr:peptidoglycan DD-metalloendopeptidase family protein [Candidatus Kapabacteria bacterium]MDW8219139.1 peptidoglycan DD-metalloendopeptidase family protein [Bacteroidota bacterium]